MKKYFNGKGTISGWQAIGRALLSYLIYGIFVAGISAAIVDKGWKVLFLLPIVVVYIWFVLSTVKKRMQSYGWKGGYLNLIFPSLTDASYPNGKQAEE